MYITSVENLQQNISVLYRYLSDDGFDEETQTVYISERSILLTGTAGGVNLEDNFEVNIQELPRYQLSVGP
jgi:hypothetical protein